MLHLGCMHGSIAILQLLDHHYGNSPQQLNDMLASHNHQGLTPLHLTVKMKSQTRQPDVEVW